MIVGKALKALTFTARQAAHLEVIAAVLRHDLRGMRQGQQRVAGIPGLGIAAIFGAGDHAAGVEPFGFQGLGRIVTGDQSAVAVEVGSKPASACRACTNCGGRGKPCFSARRSMPAQAVALK